MGRYKASWRLLTFTLGGFRFDSEERQYHVTLSFKLARDPERICDYAMTPDQARKHAESLIKAANEVEALNKNSQKG